VLTLPNRAGIPPKTTYERIACIFIMLKTGNRNASCMLSLYEMTSLLYRDNAHLFLAYL